MDARTSEWLSDVYNPGIKYPTQGDTSPQEPEQAPSDDDGTDPLQELELPAGHDQLLNDWRPTPEDSSYEPASRREYPGAELGQEDGVSVPSSPRRAYREVQQILSRDRQLPQVDDGNTTTNEQAVPHTDTSLENHDGRASSGSSNPAPQVNGTSSMRRNPPTARGWQTRRGR